MARCCMPRRGAAAGVLLILCSVLRLRPLVGIQLQLSFDCGVVRIHRHGMGEAPSKAPRLVRAAEFRSRGGDDSLGPPATCPRFGQMEVGLNGAAARGRRSRSKCTVMRLPSKHERQPRRSAIVLEAPDRDRPRSGPHCTESTYGVVVARPSGTQRAEKAALTCDGAVTYSFTTQHTKDETIRAPPTRTRHRRTPTLPHTRRAAHGERGIRVNPHMNRAKAAGQKPMFAFFSKICEPAREREPRKMPTSIESRSAPVSRDERRRGHSTACVTQRRPCSPSRSHGGPTPHARSDWTML